MCFSKSINFLNLCLNPMIHIDKLVEIFVRCDDFYQEFESFLNTRSVVDPLKKLSSLKCGLAPSEVMTIVIFYHLSGYKCFKYYYQKCVLGELREYFPKAVSYSRFVSIKKRVNIPLYCFIHCCGFGKITGIGYIDSTKHYLKKESACSPKLE